MGAAQSMGMMIVAIFLGTSGVAYAGKLSGEDIKPKVRYKITVCERPDKPKIKGKTAEEYETATSAYDAYTTAQQQFADCVEREASGDLKMLQDILFIGGQEAIARSQRDIDSLKVDLEALRARLVNKQ